MRSHRVERTPRCSSESSRASCCSRSPAAAWRTRRPAPDAGQEYRSAVHAPRPIVSDPATRQAGRRLRSGPMSMPTARVSSPLNRDYERRPYWHAMMPAIPSHRDRPFPDAADVVVIGGGYTGINAARVLARSGAAVTLLEAETLGFGGSTRNGGIVHPGYKWGPQELIDRYGEETGRALFAETMDAYGLVKRLIADEAIECEFRECGYLDVAWAPSHARDLEASVETLRRFGIDASFVARDDLHDEIGSTFYHGGLVFPPSGLLHPGKYFAGLARAADRAGADLHEGIRARAVRREANGRLVVETERGAVRTKDVVVATNGYTD